MAKLDVGRCIHTSAGVRDRDKQAHGAASKLPDTIDRQLRDCAHSSQRGIRAPWSIGHSACDDVSAHLTIDFIVIMQTPQRQLGALSAMVSIIRLAERLVVTTIAATWHRLHGECILTDSLPNLLI